MPWRPAEPEDGPEPYESGCWIWTGTVTSKGYPVARGTTTSTTAARREWERENGPVPEGYVLTADCGTRLCVRPSHHSPVTQTEVRYRTGVSKLNESLANRAYMAHKRGMSHRDVARVFSISPRTAGRIAKGEYWALREQSDNREPSDAGGKMNGDENAADGRQENEG